MTPICLTIAGSDSGGGAGIQADLRTFNWFQTYGASVITAVTAQNPGAVTAIHPVPVADVVAQCRAVLQAYPVAAVKTGMLFSAEIIAALAEELAGSTAPVVLDPVMVATSGSRLLQEDGIDTLTQELLPLATVITPNLPEAEILLETSITSRKAMLDSVRELGDQFDAVLLKGGHLAETPGTDYLAVDGGVFELSAEPVEVMCSHGTGCTLSSAIAANLALGHTVLDAVVAAKSFVWHSLKMIVPLGESFVGLYPPKTIDRDVVSVRRL